MSTQLSREELIELLPAYALGSLDVDERAAVEVALARYPDIRRDLDEHRLAALGLAHIVPQRTPPPALRASILGAAAPRGPSPRVTWWDRLIDLLGGPRLAGGLAVAALAMVAGIIVVQAIAGAQAAQRLALAQQQAAQAQAILSTSSEAVRLSGTQNAPSALATVHFAPDEPYAALQVSNLPPLPQTQAYQLWLVDTTGKRWSGAVFNTVASGASLVLVQSEVPMSDIVRFGVSREPAGGSPSPTGPAVLRSVQS